MVFSLLTPLLPGTAHSETMSELESSMGTMVINESSENTMKQYGTAPGQGAYRPDFMEHFEGKVAESSPASVSTDLVGRDEGDVGAQEVQETTTSLQDAAELEANLAEQMDLQRQFQQIAGQEIPRGQG